MVLNKVDLPDPLGPITAITPRTGTLNSTDRNATTIDLTRFRAQGGGLDLSGSGQLATAGPTIAGRADLEGSATGVRSGIEAVDALIGNKATFAAGVRRDAAGAVALDRFTLTGAGAKVSGAAQFDPASNVVDAGLTLDVPQLKPLGAALGTAITGAVSARINAQGPVERLQLRSDVEGRDITTGGRALDRFRISGEVADLSQPKAAINGSFRALGQDGSLAVSAELNGKTELVVPRLRVQAADSSIDGNLRIDLASGLAQGSLAARLPDLSRWSGLAGRPLGGGFDLRATLATTSARAAGASSLTAAELRLLPLLPTHLSYGEIGDRLHVSKNTVKTQAYSAYRKLGVSSRSEAVVRARELGLDAG